MIKHCPTICGSSKQAFHVDLETCSPCCGNSTVKVPHAWAGLGSTGFCKFRWCHCIARVLQLFCPKHLAARLQFTSQVLPRRPMYNPYSSASNTSRLGPQLKQSMHCMDRAPGISESPADNQPATALGTPSLACMLPGPKRNPLLNACALEGCCYNQTGL